MIGTNYETFGTLLLNDKQGEKIDGITEKADAKRTNLSILKRWLRGEGVQDSLKPLSSCCFKLFNAAEKQIDSDQY